MIKFTVTYNVQLRFPQVVLSVDQCPSPAGTTHASSPRPLGLSILHPHSRIWTHSRIKNKTCQSAEELLVSQRPSILSAQLCLRTSSCSWVTLFLGGWWQDLHSGHRKTLQSATRATKKFENPLRGSTSCAAALCREAHQLMGLGQSLQDPHSLMIRGKPWRYCVSGWC